MDGSTKLLENFVPDIVRRAIDAVAAENLKNYQLQKSMEVLEKQCEIAAMDMAVGAFPKWLAPQLHFYGWQGLGISWYFNHATETTPEEMTVGAVEKVRSDAWKNIMVELCDNDAASPVDHKTFSAVAVLQDGIVDDWRYRILEINEDDEVQWSYTLRHELDLAHCIVKSNESYVNYDHLFASREKRLDERAPEKRKQSSAREDIFMGIFRDLVNQWHNE